MCVFDRTWLDKVDFLLVLDAGIKDLAVELEFVESFFVHLCPFSRPTFGNLVQNEDPLSVRVPTLVRGLVQIFFDTRNTFRRTS
jgi:hypothetical protein